MGITLQRVASPAPRLDCISDSESEFSSHGSDSETEILLRGMRPSSGVVKKKPARQKASPDPSEYSPASTMSSTAVSRSMLLSRLADAEGVVSVTMLPSEFALDECDGEHVQTLHIQ